MVACRDASFASSEGVRTCKLTMTDNLPAKNTGDRNKTIPTRDFVPGLRVVSNSQFWEKVYSTMKVRETVSFVTKNRFLCLIDQDLILNIPFH